MERIKIIPNGKKVINTFSPEEFQRREANLRALMEKEQLDAIVFTSIHNINYYSDFLYCSFGRPYALVVNKTSMTTVSANIDAGAPWRRSVGDNIVYTDWRRDNFFHAVKELVGQVTRVGVEFDHITKARLDQLNATLSGSKLVDIAIDCCRIRMIKSEEEITHISAGAKICNVGAAALIDAIGEGVGEHEVALASTDAMVREIAKRFPNSELMDTWTWFQSGINTDGAHNPVTTRRIEKGDILSLNCFSMVAGYYVALERTLFYDYCDEVSKRYWEVNVEVFERGMELIRPGVRCCDIAIELNKIYKKHNLLERRTFGYGHSFGVLSHYYGREALVEIREDVETELMEDMVVSMEPMIMIDDDQPGGGGYREHDILVLTKGGARNITNFPYGPENHIIK